MKAYSLKGTGRTVPEQDMAVGATARRRPAAARPEPWIAGLAVLIMHAGGDGDYVLIHSWIKGHMADLAISPCRSVRSAEVVGVVHGPFGESTSGSAEYLLDVR